MNELKIDLSSESYLDKVLNEKEKISNNVIIFIKKDFKDKELIEKRLKKLLNELSDKNREIIIENNYQEYQISLDSIIFKKFIIKDLMRKEKIDFINLNSIKLSINNGFYEISETYCEKIIIKNRKIRSISFINTKIDSIDFEFLKINRLSFVNSLINNINFEQIIFDSKTSINECKINHLNYDQVNFKEIISIKKSEIKVMTLKNINTNKLIQLIPKIKEKDFLIYNSNINNLSTENVFFNYFKLLENSNCNNFFLKNSKIIKFLIKKSNLNNSFILEESHINNLCIQSSTSFRGYNFRINNCNISYAKFESVYFLCNTTQFYYNNKSYENMKCLDDLVFKHCVFKSTKTTFSNGIHRFVSFYKTLLDGYVHFNPKAINYLDFNHCSNNNIFKFKYDLKKLKIINFSNFINMGKFILLNQNNLRIGLNPEFLYNKIINYRNYLEIIGMYNNLKIENNALEYSYPKLDYIKNTHNVIKDIFNQNKMYEYEDKFYFFYNEDIFNEHEKDEFELKNILKHYFYKISDYGSNYSKLIKAMVLLIFAFSGILSFIICFFQPENLHFQGQEINNDPFLSFSFKIIYFTTITFFTVGYGDFTPVGFWVRVFAGIISFVGVFLSAYLIAVFTRKMMRK